MEMHRFSIPTASHLLLCLSEPLLMHVQSGWECIKIMKSVRGQFPWTESELHFSGMWAKGGWLNIKCSHKRDSIGEYHSRAWEGNSPALTQLRASVFLFPSSKCLSSYRTADVNGLVTLSIPMPHYSACLEILLTFPDRDMKCEIISNSNRVSYSAFSHVSECWQRSIDFILKDGNLEYWMLSCLKADMTW